MKRLFTISLGVTTLLGVVWVATPMVLVWPFRAQTPGGLAVARLLRAWSAPSTSLLLALGLIASILLWFWLALWKGRALAGLAIVALAACAFYGRRNTFEAMFHPLPHPAFIEASEAKEVAEEDLVLGVQIGDQARAYPVRAMGYHHLVNDLIAGEPIVATY